jgi:integrase
LSAVLNYGVYCGWLAANPAKKCSIGSKNAEERPVWSLEEYALFRQEIMDEPDAFYAFETLYFTGLRKGELLALTIADMNFETNTLRINKSLQILKGREVVTSPKTKMSVRNVRINSALAEELKEYIASRPDCAPSDRLFLINKYILRRQLQRGTELAGLDPITIHCFRHSHITNLIAAGYSPADIAKRVGHESIYITLHYSHAFKNVETDIANSLDKHMEVFK